MRWPRSVAGAGALLVLLSLPVNEGAALERTVVGVRLTVPHAGVIASLGPDTTQLVGHIQSSAATLLARTFPFVTFVPGDAPRYVFTLRLANRNEKPAGASRGIDELGLHIGLTDRGARGHEIFRTVRALGERPRGFAPWDALALELETVLGRLDQPAVVESVLARVSIADSAFCWDDPVGWVLPYGRADLCLGDRTQLVVRTEMPSGVSNRTPIQFTAELQGEFTRADRCAACVARLFSAGLTPLNALDQARAQRDSVRTIGVHVSKMERLDPCPVLPAPGGGSP